MRDLVVLFFHLLVRLAGSGGARAAVADSVLLKHQLLILNRSRRRASNRRLADRIVAGVCALLVRPSRLIRSAIVLRPAMLLRPHRALRQRKYRQPFSTTVPKKPGPKGPNQELIAAVVAMKQRNPSWGRPRIGRRWAGCSLLLEHRLFAAPNSLTTNLCMDCIPPLMSQPLQALLVALAGLGFATDRIRDVPEGPDGRL